jgi:phycocyanin-associated rod linker protein
LNYKHLLGRAPHDQAEIAFHSDLSTINRVTKPKLIPISIHPNTINTSARTLSPTIGGFASQTGQKTVGFSRLFQVYRGYATSDRLPLKEGKLTRELAYNSASPVYINGTGQSLTGLAGGDRGKFYRLRVVSGAKAGRQTRVRRSVSRVSRRLRATIE